MPSRVKTPTTSASNGGSDYSIRRVSTSRDIRPAMDTEPRPGFLHRSRSTLHDARHGFSHLFASNGRSSSPVSTPTLSSAIKIEEEKNPKYNPTNFYPAKIDEVLNDRYRIITKLGYGMTATVWLAHDLRA